MLTFSFCFLERKEHCVLLLERTAYHFFLFSWEDSLPLHSLTWEDGLPFLFILPKSTAYKMVFHFSPLFSRGRLTISLNYFWEEGLQEDGLPFLSFTFERKEYNFTIFSREVCSSFHVYFDVYRLPFFHKLSISLLVSCYLFLLPFLFSFSSSSVPAGWVPALFVSCLSCS